MMQIIPQNIATKIFKEARFQKWEYQKPYLLDVIEKTQKLLHNETVAMTDLKPDNTLCDMDARKATIIDLGGAVKLYHKSEITKFNIAEYSFQSTEKYTAKELNQKAGIIDIGKSLAYSVGKIIEEITEHTDCSEKEKQAISSLTKHLLSDSPQDRASLETAMTQLKEVMLLLGSAGSGKSIALQLKFMEAIEKWKDGDALPIYFNLASNINLEEVIESFNEILGTNLSVSSLQGAHLYIDSFDEGIGIHNKRETLIKEYLTKVKGAKILISCRTEYLPNDNDHSWFMPESKKLDSAFVAPINYKGHDDKQNDQQDDEQDNEQNDNQRNASLKKYITKYLSWAKNQKDSGGSKIHDTEDQYLAVIDKLGIEPLINTGFMFGIVMKTLPLIEEKLSGNKDYNQGIKKALTKNDIYAFYVENHITEKLSKLTDARKKGIENLLKDLPIKDLTATKEQSLASKLTELGKYLATNLHLKDLVRLHNKSDLFKALDYDGNKLFTKQTLYHLFKLLPLKIESKTLVNKQYKLDQEIETGFIHDTVKNHYLLEAIKDEIKNKGQSEILEAKNIVGDVELLKFIITGIANDSQVKAYLRKAIDQTKTDKSYDTITLAANAITLLVGSGYSFSYEDLTNISIKGANIQNGIFYGTDLSGADLTNVNMTNVNLMKAKLAGTILQSVKLSILPDLLGHTREVMSASFSPDGKYVVSSSEDSTVKIWEVSTGTCLKTIEGNPEAANAANFSADGKCVVSSSGDEIKIWDAATGECLADLQGHKDYVNSASFSADGKCVVSSSGDKIKIWDAATGTCITTINGHTSGELITTIDGHKGDVNSASFSPDGKYVVSSSEDCTLKIWEAATGTCLKTMLGHTNCVRSANFSPDGKYVVSASEDKTVKIWARISDNYAKWKLEKNIKNGESPLNTTGAIFDNVINLSEQNQKVFEQREAKFEGKVISKEVKIDEINLSEQAEKTADKLSEEITKTLLKTKLIEAEQKIGLTKVAVKISAKQSEQKVANTTSSEQSQNNTTCCKIFAINEIKYNNELLNNMELFNSLKSTFGISTDRVVDISTNLSEIFGFEDSARVCSDNDLINELIGNVINEGM